MGYYFLAIGVVISGFSLWAMVNSLTMLLAGIHTRGVIVGVDEQTRRGSNRDPAVYFHPVIEFEQPDGGQGDPFQFTFGSGSTRKRPVIGDQVAIVYRSGKPDTAMVKSFMGLWAGPLAAAVLGGGCVYAGVQIAFFGA